MLKLELELISQADCDKVGIDGRYYYTAHAIDKNGNVYTIEWVSYENWDELIEEGLADDICDWNVPYSIHWLDKIDHNED